MDHEITDLDNRVIAVKMLSLAAKAVAKRHAGSPVERDRLRAELLTIAECYADLLDGFIEIHDHPPPPPPKLKRQRLVQ